MALRYQAATRSASPAIAQGALRERRLGHKRAVGYGDGLGRLLADLLFDFVEFLFHFVHLLIDVLFDFVDFLLDLVGFLRSVVVVLAGGGPE